MKSNYLITLNFLKAHEACEDWQSEFERVFPNGGKYQVVLDRCADENRMDFAQWLMNICGPSDDVRTFEDDIDEPDKNIAFAGTLYFKKGANVKRILAGLGIEAGEGIKAGYDIEAGEGIKAGRIIDAGWSIEAGNGYGIFAGLNVKVSDWSKYAIVTARNKPANLMTGFWKSK